MLGNGRLEAFCFDGKVRLCHMCVASVRGGAAGGEAECQLPLRLPSLQPRQDAQEGVGRRRRHHHGLAARLPGACGPVSLRVARLCFTWLGGVQDDKGDVILKYTADEARQLKSSGQLPENGAAGGACPRSPGRACTSFSPSSPFFPAQLPVTELDAPGYSAVVKHPMDLTTMRALIEEGRVSKGRGGWT